MRFSEGVVGFGLAIWCVLSIAAAHIPHDRIFLMLGASVHYHRLAACSVLCGLLQGLSATLSYDFGRRAGACATCFCWGALGIAITTVVGHITPGAWACTVIAIVQVPTGVGRPCYG